MATRFTRNLKLRLTDGMTADSIYNLEKLDELGATLLPTTSNDLFLRSTEDIVLEPHSGDIGGDGTGGTVSVGTAGHQISDFYVYADELHLLNGILRIGTNALDIQGSNNNLTFVTTGDTLLTLPEGPGTVALLSDIGDKEDTLGNPVGDGYYLSSTAAGVRSWVSPSAIVPSRNEAITWIQAEGTVKTIVHGYDTVTVDVQIYDNGAQSFTTVNSITYPDSNTVRLEALTAPPAAGYAVYIREVQ